MFEQDIDDEIAQAYAQYYAAAQGAGDKSYLWAIEALDQLAAEDPLRAWKIIRAINGITIANAERRLLLQAMIGCGPMEEMIALHTDLMLPKILRAAADDAAVRAELSEIAQEAVGPQIWIEIQAVLGQG